MSPSGAPRKETCILLSPSSAGSTKSSSPSSTTKVPDVAVTSFEDLSRVITAFFSLDISINSSDEVVSTLPQPPMIIANAARAATRETFIFFILLNLLLHIFSNTVRKLSKHCGMPFFVILISIYAAGGGMPRGIFMH